MDLRPGHDGAPRNVTFEAFYREDYSAAVVPANTAIESRVTQFLGDYLGQSLPSLGKEPREQFLENGATYSHQLKVLIPLICKLESKPQIPAQIHESLRQLNGLRNDIAHRAKPRRTLTRTDVVRLLVSTALGAVYMDYLRKELIKPPKQ